MSSLNGKGIKDSYAGLIKINQPTKGTGIDLSLKTVEDGSGVASPLKLSSTQIAINGQTLPTTGTSGQYLKATATDTLSWSALGTMALQNTNAVAITGGTITGLSAPVNGSDAATKAYVDSKSGASTSVYSTGDIGYFASTPSADWLLANGTQYLQTAYPALYNVVPATISATFPSAQTGAWPSAYVNGELCTCNGLLLNSMNDASYPVTFSSNGLTWNKSTVAPFTGGYATSFAYGASMYVAVGISGGIKYASNFQSTWTTSTCPTILNSNTLKVARYFNNKFYCCGSNGAYGYSSDGITWTAVTVDSNVTVNFTNISYGNGVFVLIGAEVGTNVGYLATSTDGVTWTRQTGTPFTTIGGIDFGKGIFVAAGAQASGNCLATSKDGINWTVQASGLASNVTISQVKFGGIFMVNVPTLNAPIQLIVSVDGVNWVTKTTGLVQTTKIGYIGGYFVFYGSNGSAPAYSYVLPTGYDAASRFVVPNISLTAPTVAYIKS